MSNSIAQFKQSVNSVLKSSASQYPSVRAEVIMPPDQSVCVMICRIREYETYHSWRGTRMQECRDPDAGAEGQNPGIRMRWH